MENKQKEKKQGLEINTDFDFNFAVKLNPMLRWILVLPMGIVGLLMVQLAGGWIVSFMLRGVAEDSILAIVVTALFGVVKYCIFLIAMAATAPVTRQYKLRTSLVLAFIPFAVPFVLERIVRNLGGGIDSSMMVLNVGVVVVGVAIALASIRSGTNKPLPEPQQEEIPAQDPPSGETQL